MAIKKYANYKQLKISTRTKIMDSNENIIHNCIEFKNKYFEIDTWLFKENFISGLEKVNIKYKLIKIKRDIEGEYTRIELFNGMKI